MKNIIILLVLIGLGYYFFCVHLKSNTSPKRTRRQQQTTTMLEANLRSGQVLLQRSHSSLSPEEVALKNAITFVLHDWRYYPDTLADGRIRQKFLGKSSSPSDQSYQQQALERADQSFRITSSSVSGNTARVTIAEYFRGKYEGGQILELEQTSRGWVVTESKLENNPSDCVRYKDEP